jgi:hypothetical protein
VTSRIILIPKAVTVGGASATNLAYTASPTNGVVTSDTGTDATVPLSDGTNAGLLSPAQHTKLAGIENGATADMTAAEILAALLTVGGSGSGLDADLLDGLSSAAFQPVDSDLTAIAALSTTTYGRALLTLANQAALMGLLSSASDTAQGIVELATNAETATGTDITRAVTPASLASVLTSYLTTAAATAGYQPLDSDLTAIAALTTTSYGRTLLTLSNLAALQAVLGTGTPSATTYLRGDGTWATPSGGTTLAPMYLYVSTRYTNITPWPSKTTLSIGDGTCYFIPFWVTRSMTIDRVNVEVTTALASSTIRLGIYSSSNDAPGSLLADFGTADSSSTGQKELTVSQAVSAGLYYFAVVRQGGSGTLAVRAVGASNGSFTSLPATSTTFMHDFGNIHLFQTGISGALPGSVSPFNVPTANPFPSVVIRIA